jgi:hypothetical protein
MAGELPSFDDGKVLPGEKLWRLIDPSWYQVIDPQVGPEVLDAAFKGEVSLLRESMVWDYIVDTARNGKFKKWGIVELSADDIRSCDCALKVQDEPEWASDTHAIIVKASTGKPDLNRSHRIKLTALANQKSLRRPPA